MPPGLQAGQIQGVGTTLELGGISFQNLEVPEEIDHFGGFQKLVVHDFPGGIRDVMPFGWFPPEEIKWSGHFFNDPVIGANVDDRIQQILVIAQLGSPVELMFAGYSYQVLIKDFKPKPKLDFWQPYEISMVPVQDNNNPPGPPTAPSPTTTVSGLASNLGTAPGSPLTAPSFTPQSSFNASNPAVTQTNQITIPTPLPAQSAAELTSFQQSLNNALQQSLGQINQVNSPALQAQAAQVQADLTPLLSGTDSGQAASAFYTLAGVQNIENQLTPIATSSPTTTTTAGLLTTGIITTQNFVNPNFMNLAQQYYGDASQWTVIASANGYLTPSVIGIVNLVIPTLPAGST